MSVKINQIITIVILFALAYLCYVFLTKEVDVNNYEEVVIGISLPLSGDLVSYGQGAIGGAFLAQEEINRNGGIRGLPLRLIVEDDGCVPEGASAIQKLVDQDVLGLVGPICSSVAGSAMGIAQGARVPSLLIGSAPHLTSIGNYIFRNYPSDSFQGKFVAEYIVNNLKEKNVAILYTDNDWGRGIEKVFRERFLELGGKVLGVESVAQGDSDIRDKVARIKSKNPKIVYMPLYAKEGAVAVRQIKDVLPNVTIISGDTFDTDIIRRLKESDGVIYTTARSRVSDDFLRSAKQISSYDVDTNIFAGFYYDGVKILAKVIEENGFKRKDIRQGLAELKGFRGLAVERVEFDSVGDLKQGDFDVMIIKRGKAYNYSN